MLQNVADRHRDDQSDQTTSSTPAIGNEAEPGDVEAQYNLDMMCLHGEGVPKNVWEAVKWYRLAAEQGHQGALNVLGDR